MEYKNEIFVKTTSKKLIGIREVADMLSIHKSYVYRMVLHNDIPFIRVNKRTVFDVDKIDKWVEERKKWNREI